MCLAQGPQRSDAGEARTRGPSVSSQALYHRATALPKPTKWFRDSVTLRYSSILKLRKRWQNIDTFTPKKCIFYVNSMPFDK